MGLPDKPKRYLSPQDSPVNGLAGLFSISYWTKYRHGSYLGSGVQSEPKRPLEQAFRRGSVSIQRRF